MYLKMLFLKTHENASLKVGNKFFEINKFFAIAPVIFEENEEAEDILESLSIKTPKNFGAKGLKLKNQLGK